MPDSKKQSVLQTEPESEHQPEHQPAHKVPKNILRPTGRAICEFDMIKDGDKVMLGLSGGKDSLSLLHILRHFQRHAPIKFELAAITIDPMIDGFHPEHLKPYLAEMGIPYFYEAHDIEGQAKEHMQKDSFCSFCSRIKRGIMYTTLRREGYNVLALAQHLDDLAESFLMSAFHGGQLRTMKANYLNKQKDIRIIRPLVYIREAQTRHYAERAALPVVVDSCPACFDMPTQRQHMKELLAGEEAHNKNIFKSLKKAMHSLYSQDTAD